MIAAMTAVIMASCAHSHDLVEDDPGVSLRLRVNTVSGSTRASTAGAFEKIATLRVLVLDDRGDVEIDRLFTDLTGYDFTYRHSGNIDFVINGLTPGDKTLYLFANEEGMNQPSGALDADAESVSFKGFRSDWYLPYSAKYNVTLGKGSENYRQLFLVPAATKFSFVFYNYRQNDVKVNSININSIAGRQYLLGAVGETDLYKSLPSDSERLYWVDWLAKVAEMSWVTEGSQTDNENFNETYGWISDYSVPPGTVHSPVTVTGIPSVKAIASGSASPSYVELVYLPESRNLASGKQKYSLMFDIEGAGHLKEVEFELPNVKALFRDTHVKVTVTMTDLDINVNVDVDPWDEDELNPEFGSAGSGTVDNDPWDENEQNPEFGIHVWTGTTDADPWDENELNPGFGTPGSASSDNDPWDENNGNPQLGTPGSANPDNDPWDENNGNPQLGTPGSANPDNDPWDENTGNPQLGTPGSSSSDTDPWDDTDLNPGFGK